MSIKLSVDWPYGLQYYATNQPMLCARGPFDSQGPDGSTTPRDSDLGTRSPTRGLAILFSQWLFSRHVPRLSMGMGCCIARAERERESSRAAR